jgi:osmotically-inducible protein OsmY
MDRSRRFTLATTLAVTMAAFAPLAAAAAATAGKSRLWRPDAAIRADVVRTLEADRALDDSSIGVRSVLRGVVVLTGEASTPNDLARAIRDTTRRPGVRRVLSEVATVDSILPAPAPAREPLPIVMPPPFRYAFVDAGDAAIRQDVERAIDDLGSVENEDIRVLVQDGVVRLSGTVPTWDGNDARLKATRSVTGVRSILNGVRVVASSSDRR